MISPGKVFRRDTDDATHSHQFHQIEGLVIDKNITMADLKRHFRSGHAKMFGADRKNPFAPKLLPIHRTFREVDVSCFKCGGAGCNVCNTRVGSKS